METKTVMIGADKEKILEMRDQLNMMLEEMERPKESFFRMLVKSIIFIVVCVTAMFYMM